jgi:hypothetical protein
MSGRNGRSIAICFFLAALGIGTSRAEDPPRPIYPNLLVEVSQAFANAAAAAEPHVQSSPINQNQDKMRTSGCQTTQVWVSTRFIPSAQAARIEILLNGNTDAVTRTTRGKVELGHTTHVSLLGNKLLAVDDNGVREESGDAHANLDVNHLDFLRTSFRCPVDPLVRRIAHRVYNKQKSKIDSDIEKQANQELDKQFRTLAADKIKEINDRYEKDYRKPMQAKGVFPQRIRLMTSETQLGIRALLNDPTGKPMNFAPVPEIYGWPDVAVRVEETLLNNYSQGEFGNKTFSGPALDEEFSRLIGPVIGKVKTADVGEKDFTITFAKEKPIEFHFNEQKFKVTLRGEEFTSGGREYLAMDTTAIYKLHKTATGLIAEREGDLVIYPPGFKKGDRLSASDKVLQELLVRKFGKVFKESFELKEVKLPEAIKGAGVLVTTQVESDKGWLTLGFRRQPASVVSAAPANAMPEPR